MFVLRSVAHVRLATYSLYYPRFSRTPSYSEHVLPCPVVVQYLETEEGEEEQLSALQSEKYTQEVLRAVFSGMHSVLAAALRQPGLKVEVHLYNV